MKLFPSNPTKKAKKGDSSSPRRPLTWQVLPLIPPWPPGQKPSLDLSSWWAWAGVGLKTTLMVTVALYILNQNHCLPRPLAAVVSKALFWPTLPITWVRRKWVSQGQAGGGWTTLIDDTVIMGGVPLGSLPETLYEQYGVRAVINLCDEYRGPLAKYQKMGIQQLWLPTVDHFEPHVDDLEKAVDFIQQFKIQHHHLSVDTHYRRSPRRRVYVHCRAGHGRSAAVVFAWLLSQNPNVNLQDLNRQFCRIRHVRKSLWKQPHIREFHTRLLQQQQHSNNKDDTDTNDAEDEESKKEL